MRMYMHTRRLRQKETDIWILQIIRRYPKNKAAGSSCTAHNPHPMDCIASHRIYNSATRGGDDTFLVMASASGVTSVSTVPTLLHGPGVVLLLLLLLLLLFAAALLG